MGFEDCVGACHPGKARGNRKELWGESNIRKAKGMSSVGLPWLAQTAKNLPAMQEMQETQVQTLGWEDPLEEKMAAHSIIFAWRIPWAEKPGRLQSMGSQRVRHS